MNGLWKKAARLAAIGAAIGALIALGFLLFEHRPETFLGTQGGLATVLYVLYCCLFGAACMGGQVVYEIEDWGLTRATLTHFAITLGGFCLLWYLLGMFRPGDAAFWIIVAAYIAASFVVWLIQFLSCRRQVRQMNEELKNWKKRRGAE